MVFSTACAGRASCPTTVCVERTVLLQIFIDESGTFSQPKDTSKPSVSGVGALILRDSERNAVYAEFEKLKKSWGKIGEVKGSLLNEGHIPQVISLLKKYGAIFEATVIDLSLENQHGITEHKQKQSEKLLENPTPSHNPGLIESVAGAADKLSGTPNQLYVQSCCTYELIHRVIQNTTLYFSLRYPSELSSFKWRIDAKDTVVTPYEDLWKTLVGGLLQSKSAREPLIQITEGDYSAFSGFTSSYSTTPGYLIPLFGVKSPFETIEVGTIWRGDNELVDSGSSLGIQLVDILITSLRRAMSGTLQTRGWATIGALMLSPGSRSTVPQIISLSDTPTHQSVPYRLVFNLCERYSRPVIK